MSRSTAYRTPMLASAARIAFGYSAAVIVAVTLAVTLFFLSEKEASGMLTFIAGLYAGSIITTVCALPGFLAALVLAARLRWKTWTPYAIAGGLNVIPAELMLNLWSGQPLLTLPAMLLTCLPGGIAGGMAYWATAERLVGKNRRLASP